MKKLKISRLTADSRYLETVALNSNIIIIYNITFSTLQISLVQGIMLVYDITQDKTFDNISKWLRNIEEVTCYVTLKPHVFQKYAKLASFKQTWSTELKGWMHNHLMSYFRLFDFSQICQKFCM